MYRVSNAQPALRTAQENTTYKASALSSFGLGNSFPGARTLQTNSRTKCGSLLELPLGQQPNYQTIKLQESLSQKKQKKNFDETHHFYLLVSVDREI